MDRRLKTMSEQNPGAGLVIMEKIKIRDKKEDRLERHTACQPNKPLGAEVPAPVGRSL